MGPGKPISHEPKHQADRLNSQIIDLAGQRGWATIQTRYASLADYERIDAEMDKDEEYSGLLQSMIGDTGELPVDQFYRVIQ